MYVCYTCHDSTNESSLIIQLIILVSITVSISELVTIVLLIFIATVIVNGGTN